MKKLAIACSALAVAVAGCAAGHSATPERGSAAPGAATENGAVPTVHEEVGDYALDKAPDPLIPAKSTPTVTVDGQPVNLTGHPGEAKTSCQKDPGGTKLTVSTTSSSPVGKQGEEVGINVDKDNQLVNVSTWNLPGWGSLYAGATTGTLTVVDDNTFSFKGTGMDRIKQKQESPSRSLAWDEE